MQAKDLINFLEWDSNFFGFKVGKSDLNNLESTASEYNRIIKESDYKLIYCFADPTVGTASYIEEIINGAILVDTKVTYVKRVLKNINLESQTDQQIQSVIINDNEIQDLAIQAGIYSRFCIDANFESPKYEQLYKLWIENSINRKIADEVVVYKEARKVEGLLTIGTKINRADIGLVSVDELARGKGIATKLLKYAEQYSSIHGFEELQVVTQQNNTPACKLYERYGFSLESTVNIFHIWK